MQRRPGSELDSPTTWHFKETPEVVEGRIACGIHKDIPDIVWSRNGDLLVGDALGDNLEALHNWWLAHG